MKSFSKIFLPGFKFNLTLPEKELYTKVENSFCINEKKLQDPRLRKNIKNILNDVFFSLVFKPSMFSLFDSISNLILKTRC
jgi:hypothetical protein